MNNDTSITEELKHFMRSFPQGVTLVTTHRSGRLLGITVSSFTSLSLDPPLILIAISKDASSHDDFVGCEYFNVQLLSSDQDSLALKFAKKIVHDEKFRDLGYSVDSKDNPVMDGVLANLECSNYQVYDAGDHSLILGKVEKARVLRESSPLVYHNRQFTTVK
ncbi:MAG: flavin reductase family protein [Nitrososphaerales archaeon]